MRHFRASDELWDAAQRAVNRRGDPSVSFILREALVQYVEATERQGDTRPAINRGANIESRRRRIKRWSPP
jgi:hypothetical protein